MLSSHVFFLAIFFIIYGIATYSSAEEEICEPIACKGEQGPEGKTGDTGDRGEQGNEGDRGDKGTEGDGLQGDQGKRGYPGQKGEEGDKGKDGEKGAKGERGEPAPPTPPSSRITIFYEKEPILKPVTDNVTSTSTDAEGYGGNDADADYTGPINFPVFPVHENYSTEFSLAYYRHSGRLVVLIENFDGNGTAKEIELETNRATLAQVLMSSNVVITVMLLIVTAVTKY